IVGVVKDSAGDSLRQAMRSQVYFPYLQRGGAPFPVTMEVRTGSSLAAIAQALQRQLQPKLGLPPEVRTMTSEVDRTLVQERMMPAVAGTLGVLAVSLAAVGLYGLLAYSVARRTREIGIRMALGAQRGRVLRSVIAGAFRL